MTAEFLCGSVLGADFLVTPPMRSGLLNMKHVSPIICQYLLLIVRVWLVNSVTESSVSPALVPQNELETDPQAEKKEKAQFEYVLIFIVNFCIFIDYAFLPSVLQA